MDELRRIIEDSEIMAEDDELWPQPDRVGRQELEIVIGDEHISFTTSKIGRSDNFFLNLSLYSNILPLLPSSMVYTAVLLT